AVRPRASHPPRPPADPPLARRPLVGAGFPDRLHRRPRPRPTARARLTRAKITPPRPAELAPARNTPRRGAPSAFSALDASLPPDTSPPAPDNALTSAQTAAPTPNGTPTHYSRSERAVEGAVSVNSR